MCFLSQVLPKPLALPDQSPGSILAYLREGSGSADLAHVQRWFVPRGHCPVLTTRTTNVPAMNLLYHRGATAALGLG